MNDTGFAIRCPYCGNWDVHENEHPKDFAIKANEISEIMTKFHKASRDGSLDSFLNREKRLFRCIKPRWACPASFELFIFDNEQKALLSLQKIKEKWAISRDFRLYRADKIARWEGEYYGIMFGTEPVRRLQDIELEHLLDTELMSKIISGICQEIKAPANIYSANVVSGAGQENLYWMPIEHYADENSLLPVTYNLFCETCRRLTIEGLEREFIRRFRNSVRARLGNVNEEFERNKLEKILMVLKQEKNLDRLPIDPAFCPFKNPVTNTKYWDEGSQKCAGREPACRKTAGNGIPIDLNHCPAFIDLRREHCFCYSSDMRLIEKIRNTWKEEVSQGASECPANFIEMGMPIIVHEHLIGVMMIGQMFKHKRPIASIDDFEKNVSVRTQHSLILAGKHYTPENILKKQKLKNELAMVRHVMLWQEEQASKEDKRLIRSPKTRKARFLVRDDDIEYRIHALRKNLQRIRYVAEARYRDLRSRSEEAFRDEIMGYIYHKMIEKQRGSGFAFFSGETAPITHVLRRMIDFWAFKAVAYLWRDKDDTVYLTSYATDDQSNPGEAYGFLAAHNVGEIKVDKFQEHPVCWLFDPEHDTRPPQNEVVRQLYQSLLDYEPQLHSFGIPTDGCYFLVVVPFEGVIYSFIFAKRNKELLSRTDAKKSSAISELCMEFMLRTCTEIVCELCDVMYRENHALANLQFDNSLGLAPGRELRKDKH